MIYQEWIEDAACAGDAEFELPKEWQVATCRNMCPVRAECLDYGLRTASEGVWGGHNLEGIEGDRARVIRAELAEAAQGVR